MLFNLKIGRNEEDTLSSLSHQLVDKVITGFTYKRHPGFITVQFDMQKKDIHSIPESVDVHEFERIRTERNEMMGKADKLTRELADRDKEISKLNALVKEGDGKLWKDTLKNLKRSVRMLETQVKNKDKAIEKLKGKMADKDDSIKSLKSINKEDIKTMKSLKETIKGLESRIESNGIVDPEEVAKLKVNLKTARSQETRYRNKAAMLQKAIDELKDELKRIKQLLSTYKHQSKELRSKNRELKTGRKDLDLSRTIWEGGNALPVTKLSIKD